MADPQRILFIDADEESRNLATDFLKEQGFGAKDGYFIVELSNIETGFAALERDADFIAVVTAWKNPDQKGNYPKFDGLELLRRIRGHRNEKIRSLPVIIHTVDPRAFSGMAEMNRCAMVSKMLTHSELAPTLRTLLDV